MLKQLKKDNRGFSLVEILAVIVILGIIAGVGIPAAISYIQKSRQDSFFESVTEVVETVSEANSLNGANHCVYENKAAIITNIESQGLAEKTADIEEIYIYTWLNNAGKKMYAVEAKSKETGAIIDTTDFYSLTMKNKGKWNENTYNPKLTEIINDLEINNTKDKYAADLAKCDLGGTR